MPPSDQAQLEALLRQLDSLERRRAALTTEHARLRHEREHALLTAKNGASVDLRPTSDALRAVEDEGAGIADALATIGSQVEAVRARQARAAQAAEFEHAELAYMAAERDMTAALAAQSAAVRRAVQIPGNFATVVRAAQAAGEAATARLAAAASALGQTSDRGPHVFRVAVASPLEGQIVTFLRGFAEAEHFRREPSA
jgi:chromosome segregation ATPase